MNAAVATPAVCVVLPLLDRGKWPAHLPRCCTVTMALNIQQPMRSYEEWKTDRLETVGGRCGGRPTFRGTRLQPHDIADYSLYSYREVKGSWPYITEEDLKYAKRFVQEEPHWKVLSRGIDQNGRELTDAELNALREQYQ